MSYICERDTVHVLGMSQDERVKKMRKDAGLVKDLTKMLNTILKFTEEEKISSVSDYRKFKASGVSPKLPNMNGKGAALTGMGAASSMANVLHSAVGNEATLVGSQVIGQAAKTSSLMKLAGKTPTQVVVTLGFTTIEKSVMAAGMGNRHKCELAVASLAATSGLTFASGIPTGGVGWAVGAIAIASEIFNTYSKCTTTP